MAGNFPPAIKLEINIPQWLLFKFTKPIVKDRTDKPGEVSIRFGGVRCLPDMTDRTLFVDDQETAELITSMLERCKVAGMQPALLACKFKIPESKRHFMAFGTPEKIYWEAVPTEVLVQDSDGSQTTRTLEPPKTFFDAWSTSIPNGGVTSSAPRPQSPATPTFQLRPKHTTASESSESVNGFLSSKQLIAAAGEELHARYATIFKSVYDSLHAQAESAVEKALGEWVAAQEAFKQSPDDLRAACRSSACGDIYSAAVEHLKNVQASASTVFIQLMSSR